MIFVRWQSHATHSIITESLVFFNMRMRKKKHGAERIAACAELLFTDRAEIENFLQQNGSCCELEIGCGKGDFAITASKRANIPFIAIERSSDVAVVAMEKAKAEGCDNLHFVVGNAETLLPELFRAGEIKTLYLNFSDPWPKKGYAKRRLTHRNFLALYKQFLPEDGKIRMPFNALSGLGDTAAQRIVQAREEGSIFCVEDLRIKAGLSKTVIETLRRGGVLENLSETNQFDMFSML